MTASSTAGVDDDPIVMARRLWEEHGWTEAAAGMAMVTSVMRAQQLLLARVDAVLKPFGLTLARYEVLMLLRFSARGSLPLKRIGERLQVHPTSVTSAVDRLEAQGYVVRAPHPTDRRATLAVLTDEGRRTVEQATEAVNADVFAQPGLDGSDVESLVSLLGALRESYDR